MSAIGLFGLDVMGAPMAEHTPQVGHVLFSPRGVAGGLTPGKLVIEMNATSPAGIDDDGGPRARADSGACDFWSLWSLGKPLATVAAFL